MTGEAAVMLQGGPEFMVTLTLLVHVMAPAAFRMVTAILAGDVAPAVQIMEFVPCPPVMVPLVTTQA